MKVKIKQKHRVAKKRMLLEFADNYLNYFNELLDKFENISPNIRLSLPNIFSSRDLACEIIYSLDKDQIFITVKNGSKSSVDFTYGSPIDVLDKSGVWKKSKITAVAIGAERAFVGNAELSGNIKPFEFIGNDFEVKFSDILINFPNGSIMRLNYGFAASYTSFQKYYLNNYQEEIENYIYKSWDFYLKNDSKMDSSEKNTRQKKEYQEIIKKMEVLFFEENIKENEIDDFITSNPIILAKCFSIDPSSLLPQKLLVNKVPKLFTQDLKPDLICQNIHGDWIILDYKRSKYIIKREGTARVAVTSEVEELVTQLKHYRSYFEEGKHREYFKESTGFQPSNKPLTIGLIGRINKDQRASFHSSIEDKPGYIKISTYNDLYEQFKHLVS
ncbi:MAG: hypothetical protein K6L75_12575 [Cellvibrionaceae bacterium]